MGFTPGSSGLTLSIGLAISGLAISGLAISGLAPVSDRFDAFDRLGACQRNPQGFGSVAPCLSVRHQTFRQLESHHGGLGVRPVLSVDVPRTEAFRCQRLLNPDNDRLVHIRSVARVKLGRRADRHHIADSVVLYAWNENARVPPPVLNGIGDDAVFSSLCFNSSTLSVAQRYVPHAARRWVPEDDTANGGCRFLDRNADAQPLYILLPPARVRIRLRRLGAIVDTAIENAGLLVDQPGYELGAVPRPLPVGIVLRHLDVDIFFADMLPSPPQQSCPCTLVRSCAFARRRCARGRAREFRRLRLRTLTDKLDAGIDGHHALEHGGAADLTIHCRGRPDAIGHKLAGPLIGCCPPDIGRWDAPVKIAPAVVFLLPM